MKGNHVESYNFLNKSHFLKSFVAFILIIFCISIILCIQKFAYAKESSVVANDEPVLTAQLNTQETICTVTLSNYIESYNFVQFAVWSDASKQADLYWFTANKLGNDYFHDVAIEQFKQPGLYYVDAYATNDGINKVFIASKSFKVSAPISIETYIHDIDSDNATFQVTTKGISSASGILNAAVAVWTDKNGQDDLRWYDMTTTMQVDGTYTSTCIVNARYHNGESGVYFAHVYVNAGNWINCCVGNTFQNIEFKVGSFEVTVNEEETSAIVWLDYLGLPQGSIVKFAVWSEIGGQDDLVWYTAWQSNFSYAYDVLISNHKQYGKYFVDAYCFNGGSSQCIRSGIFTITQPSADGAFYDIDKETGKFKVKAFDAIPVKGIDNIVFACWPTSLGWQRASWKEADLSSENFYFSQYDISDFDSTLGEYCLDIYVREKNGITRCAKSVKEYIQIEDYVSVKYLGSSVYRCTVSNLSIKNVTRIAFPTWSEFGGQDDLKWYYTSTFDGEKWVGEFSAKMHWPAGIFFTDFYAFDTSGDKIFIKSVSYNVPKEAVGDEFRPLHGQKTGIDVSEHNKDIDWATVSNSGQVGYAMVRAGFGTNRADYYFEQNYANARSNGVPVGIYWYSYAENEQEAQQEAYKCLEILNGRPVELPVAFDLEQYPDIDPWVNTAMINSFCNVIANAGYTPMLYASEYWYNNKMFQDYISNNISFWVAKWSSNQPVIQKQTFMRMWQTSDCGSVPGISGVVDTDWLYY